MKSKRIIFPVHFWLVVFLMVLYVFGIGGLFISCSPAKPVEPQVQSLPPGPEPLALLQSGKFPIWFEFSEAGPRHIASPDAAAMEPFTPWPLSRHCSNMLLRENNLIMAVNLIMEAKLLP